MRMYGLVFRALQRFPKKSLKVEFLDVSRKIFFFPKCEKTSSYNHIIFLKLILGIQSSAANFFYTLFCGQRF